MYYKYIPTKSREDILDSLKGMTVLTGLSFSKTEAFFRKTEAQIGQYMGAVSLTLARRKWGNDSNIVGWNLPLFIAAFKDTLNYFDALFEQGNHHTEVYIGRDGLHLYHVRRAQLWGRKGPKPRVVYAVYNSHQRDNWSREDCKSFFRDKGVDIRDRNVLWFDTGYTGTVPKTILRHGGIVVNKNIHMWCGSDVHLIPMPALEMLLGEPLCYDLRKELADAVERWSKPTGKLKGDYPTPTIPMDEEAPAAAVVRYFFVEYFFHWSQRTAEGWKENAGYWRTRWPDFNFRRYYVRSEEAVAKTGCPNGRD